MYYSRYSGGARIFKQAGQSQGPEYFTRAWPKATGLDMYCHHQGCVGADAKILWRMSERSSPPLPGAFLEFVVFYIPEKTIFFTSKVIKISLVEKVRICENPPCPKKHESQDKIS